MRRLMALLVVAGFISCAGDLNEKDAAASDPNFFNLKEFVAQQKARMAGKTITKTVSVAGIEETKKLKEVDWELELAPFAQSNIDRPAMWDLYLVDTTTMCDGRNATIYTSLDSSNFTKSLEVIWSDRALPLDSVYALLTLNGFNSYIADTEQRLVWWQGGYTISSTQNALLSEERILKIHGIWDAGMEEPCE